MGSNIFEFWRVRKFWQVDIGFLGIEKKNGKILGKKKIVTVFSAVVLTTRITFHS